MTIVSDLLWVAIISDPLRNACVFFPYTGVTGMRAVKACRKSGGTLLTDPRWAWQMDLATTVGVGGCLCGTWCVALAEDHCAS